MLKLKKLLGNLYGVKSLPKYRTITFVISDVKTNHKNVECRIRLNADCGGELRTPIPTKVSLLSRQITTTSYLSHDLCAHRDSPDNNPKTPFEFTEANLTRLAALIQNYPTGAQRSVLGAALDIVQRQIGWVPISAMHKIAELLSVPRIRVYEYATFYTMVKKRYRGKYNVKICSTTPCMLRGAECILRAAEEVCSCSVGSLSPDGMFGVDIVECAGACANAPVMVVDDDYYEDLTECDVFNIIQQIRNGCIPPPGPQNGRYASEPITGMTSLCACPPPPGYCLQQALWGSCGTN